MLPFLRRLPISAAAVVLGLLGLNGIALAQDSWQPFNPFSDADQRTPKKPKVEAQRPSEERPYLRSMDTPPSPEGTDTAARSDSYRPAGTPAADPGPRNGPHAGQGGAPATVMREAIPPPVEKGELAPVMSGDGSGLPFELWRGLDLAGFEKLISEIEIPPRSSALHSLWKRLITSDVTPPAGETANVKFSSLRLEALYRSGLAAEASAEVAKDPPAADAITAVLSARNELANANRDKACEIARTATTLKGDMPKRVKAEAVLLNGYCAAAAGDTAGAGLAAELAREEGLQQSAGLEALDALSIGAKPKFKAPAQIGLLDYRLLEIAGATPGLETMDKAEPALLVALTNDAQSPPELRLAAAEAAARLNAVAPDGLAAIYSALGSNEGADALLAGSQTSGALRRAAMFKAAEGERTPMKKTRLIRALVDDARRSGLGFQTMQMTARAASQIKPAPELNWFIETAAEIGLASAKYGMTRAWLALAAPASADGQGFGHWLALADIADAQMQPHGQYLNELEAMALRSRFSADSLNRLATVLDALDYVVPIPLWEAASRAPQPNTGYLPETGVLSALQDAAKKKEFGHTVLLAMKALGPNGAEGAHMIALGDSIRALKRAGLEADARRLGLEALLGSWPRTAVN